MPGIVGIISQKPAAECRLHAQEMIETLRNENFHQSAAQFLPEMGIYAGCVWLEGSTNGIFSDETGAIVLVFNGESFLNSQMATPEKIIRLYKEEGRYFLEKLNGLFCGLLIDKPRGNVLLFNDRYGIQRIYLHEGNGCLYFSSEAKALLRVLPELRQFNMDGLTDFLTFGCTLNWKTLFRGITIMPGGSVWSFENGAPRKESYFSPRTWELQTPLAPAEFQERLQQTFQRILPGYFEPYSKVGIALTGGLDTRMIMACRPQTSHTPCYTFTGNNGQTLDDKIAAQIATVSKLEHTLLRLDEGFFSDFAAHADKTVFATDGCAGVFTAHELYFNRKARELAPVRLTGNYGSEILRGISTFKPLSLSPQLLNQDWAPRVSMRAASWSREKTNPVTFAAFKEVPWHLYGNLAAGRSQLHFRSPYLDNELVALAFQAPQQCRNSSMPCFNLVRASNSDLSEIPTDRGFRGDNSGLGFVTRRAFAEVTFKLDYYSVAGLPNPFSNLNSIFKPVVETLKIAGMHKFLRYSAWFRNELAAYVQDRLFSQRVRTNDVWNFEFIERMAAAHLRGHRDYSAEINAVMTLDAIERLLCSGTCRN
ncbi:MAG TPA: asparagine synthase-related protein [Alphaproteobacteria bacterium]|nr:asparagine synthase-related protein [Alphaproteobacteria bacterium]